MRETRSQRKERLQAAGKWQDFLALREQLRSQGMSAAHARKEALQQIDSRPANAPALASPSVPFPEPPPYLQCRRCRAIGQPASARAAFAMSYVLTVQSSPFRSCQAHRWPGPGRETGATLIERTRALCRRHRAFFGCRSAYSTTRRSTGVAAALTPHSRHQSAWCVATLWQSSRCGRLWPARSRAPRRPPLSTGQHRNAASQAEPIRRLQPD